MIRTWMYCHNCRMSHYHTKQDDGTWKCPNCETKRAYTVTQELNDYIRDHGENERDALNFAIHQIHTLEDELKMVKELLAEEREKE